MALKIFDLSKACQICHDTVDKATPTTLRCDHEANKAPLDGTIGATASHNIKLK